MPYPQLGILVFLALFSFFLLFLFCLQFFTFLHVKDRLRNLSRHLLSLLPVLVFLWIAFLWSKPSTNATVHFQAKIHFTCCIIISIKRVILMVFWLTFHTVNCVWVRVVVSYICLLSPSQTQIYIYELLNYIRRKYINICIYVNISSARLCPLLSDTSNDFCRDQILSRLSYLFRSSHHLVTVHRCCGLLMSLGLQFGSLRLHQSAVFQSVIISSRQRFCQSPVISFTVQKRKYEYTISCVSNRRSDLE